MSNEVAKYIEMLSNRESLSQDDSARLFQIIMNNGATPAQISAILMGLKTKGESIDELTGAVQALRHKMVKLKLSAELHHAAIDVCGTGGDGISTYNISTAVAFVVAGCGIPVAKHGNKAISSRSGSADVLGEIGVRIDLTPEQAAECLKEAGVVFLYAPTYHKAMVHVSPVRKELGIRTIFNLLGPLLNPAQVRRQLIGVYSKDLVLPICETLKKLDAISAMVVHGGDGMDEISICAETYIAELVNGKIHEYTITPEVMGLSTTTPDKIAGGDARHNAYELKAVLTGTRNEYRNAVVLNAGAALKVAGLAASLDEGMQMAADSIDFGKANGALNRLVEISNMF